MKELEIKFKVNGKPVKLKVPANITLVEILREKLNLTGTKYGCGKGECGACTVIMNGRAVNSCLILASQVNGKQITTIEGLARGNKLHPIQKAFVEHGAIQCGYCTPGMVLSAKALLDTIPAPTTTEIKRAIAGNLCRCTGYTKIVKAIKIAAKSGGHK